MKTRRKLTGQKIVEIDDWVLYSYDIDTGADNGGTVKLGFGEGTPTNPPSPGNPQGVDAMFGGERVTIPGSEIDADEGTDYWVFWDKGDQTIQAVKKSAAPDKEAVYDWNRVFLPGDNDDDTFTTTVDQTSGSGGTGTPDPGGGDRTLK